MNFILPFVEGHSEAQAIPLLLRKMRDHLKAFQIDISRPFRVKRYQIVKKGELEKAITLCLNDR